MFYTIMPVLFIYMCVSGLFFFVMNSMSYIVMACMMTLVVGNPMPLDFDLCGPSFVTYVNNLCKAKNNKGQYKYLNIYYCNRYICISNEYVQGWSGN